MCKFGADPFFRPVLVTIVVLTCLFIYIFPYFLTLNYCTNYNILIKIKIIRRIVTMIMIIIILLSLETDKNIKVYIAWTNIYIFLQEFHFAIVFYQKRMLTAKWKYFLLNNFKMLSKLAPFHFLACSKFWLPEDRMFQENNFQTNPKIIVIFLINWRTKRTVNTTKVHTIVIKARHVNEIHREIDLFLYLVWFPLSFSHLILVSRRTI